MLVMHGDFHLWNIKSKIFGDLLQWIGYELCSEADLYSSHSSGNY